MTSLVTVPNATTFSTRFTDTQTGDAVAVGSIASIEPLASSRASSDTTTTTSNSLATVSDHDATSTSQPDSPALITAIIAGMPSAAL